MSAPPLSSYRAVLGLGSNLGDRLAALRDAAARLTALSGVSLHARSQVYQSPPAGGPPQPDYLNAALSVHTELEPRTLMAHALQIERRMGRERHPDTRWGPRVIDIDVLWISRGVVDEAALVVPHPRLGERVFALRPLLDVEPLASDPRSGERYATMTAASSDIQLLEPL